MSEFISNLRYYFLVFIYSIQYTFLHFMSLLLYPNRYKPNKLPILAPDCMVDDDYGTHHYVKLSTCKFHFVQKGDPSKHLLLLLHGYPEFWYSWRNQLQCLSKYYWVIALDLKGYGDSDKPKSKKVYNVPLLVEEVYGFLTAIGRKKCTVVVHGMGGLIGWNFAVTYPDVVEEFICISSAHPQIFLEELRLKRVPQAGWYYFCQIPYLPEKEAMKQNLIIFDKLYSRMLSSRGDAFTAKDLQVLKYSFYRPEDWTGPLNYMRILMNAMKPNNETKRCTVPTLFIIGNADPFYSLEMICKSSEFVENFSLKIVEGGGHFLPQEMPNYINNLILDFVKKPEVVTVRTDGVKNPATGSIFHRIIGAGKSVVTSTVSYGTSVGMRRNGSEENAAALF